MERLRITVPLSSDEFSALRESASMQLRHPRDQARFLLRRALGLAAAPDAPFIDDEARHIDQHTQRRVTHADQ